jgi:hydrogenase large subunit
MARVVVDPLTRIEGHLRVEVEVEGGVVSDAWVSGSLFRGMEGVLKGREPDDAFYISQRICGVCPISHGHASTKGTEDALGIEVPDGARLVRNIIEGAQYLHSHILWFYTLAALDYVDVVSALSANVADTYALAEAAGTKVADFGAIQKRLQAFVDGGQLSIFTNAYFGHPGYALPPELNLIAVAHYLEALEMQARASSIIGVMGGKFPHFMTSIPGGTSFVPTEQKLDDVLFRLLDVASFIDRALIPDTLAIAPYYLEAATYGAGTTNLLSWGVFEEASNDPYERALPRGVIQGGNLSAMDADPEKVIEYVDHSWYEADSGNLNPASGITNPSFSEYSTDDKYSWGKAPRYDGKPHEVGPLARMIIAYARGVKPVQDLVDSTLEALGVAGQPEILFSLLGRVAARNLEAKYLADQTVRYTNELIEAAAGGDVSFFSSERAADGEGAGLWEAPRGSVGHWTEIVGNKIENYQVVAPTTWNIAPRDADDQRGPIEEALIGVPVTDAERPIEVLRLVHSFDP